MCMCHVFNFLEKMSFLFLFFYCLLVFVEKEINLLTWLSFFFLHFLGFCFLDWRFFCGVGGD